jgi:hypothetical protein
MDLRFWPTKILSSNNLPTVKRKRGEEEGEYCSDNLITHKKTKKMANKSFALHRFLFGRAVNRSTVASKCGLARPSL